MTTQRSIAVPPSHMHSVHLGAAPDPERGDGEVPQLIGALWRRKFLILLVLLLATALGAIYVFRIAVPYYTTHAVMTLEPSANAIADVPDVMAAFTGEDTVVNTELEILRSRGLMRDLVRKLGLAEDPEFNPALRDPPLLSLASLGLAPPTDPAAERPEDVVIDATVSELSEAISVSNVRDTYVYQIWVTTKSPEKSVRIADALMEIYIAARARNKFEATEQAARWLTQRVSDLKEELQQAEAELKEFRTTAELVGPESLDALYRQLKDLRDRHSDLSAKAEDVAARLAGFDALGDDAAAEQIAAALGEPEIEDWAARLKAGIIGRSAFDAQVQRAAQQLRTQAERDRGQARTLASAIAQLEATVEHQSDELLVLEQLEREVESSALIYETLLSRLKEVSIRNGTQQSDARVVTTAPLPTEPSAPKVGLILGMAAMVGVFAGAGLALGRERMQNTFRTAEDLERVTGETVLGEIPTAPTRKRKKLLEHLLAKRESPFSEAVRDLRTSILMADLERVPEVLMITSSIPGEGKTTQSLSLTYNFASLGKRVLLIEADIRRRPLTEYLDPQASTATLDMAVENPHELSDYVVHSPALGADVIVGGQTSINAADFFSSKAFADLIGVARQQYDIVLLDTPPVLTVPDARVIGRFADAIIYLVRWDHTSNLQVLRGLRSLSKARLKVTGLVLSQIDTKSMKRYGYSDYAGYGYGKS